MKQRKIDLNNVFMLIYGFQFNIDDNTKVEYYRNIGSKIKFLTNDNGDFVDCITGEKIDMTFFNKSLPMRMQRDLCLSKDAIEKLYTPEERKEEYVFSKGVMLGVEFDFENVGLSQDVRCNQYNMLINNILPIQEPHKLELGKLSFATYSKYTDQDEIPASRFEEFENRCNNFIKICHENQARAHQNSQIILPIKMKKNKVNDNKNNTSSNTNTKDTAKESSFDIVMEGHENEGK